MYIAARLLAFVATVRVAFGVIQLAFWGPSLPLLGAVLATTAGIAYLIWLAASGRHGLHAAEVGPGTRRIVAVYGVFALLVLPLGEVITYRLFV